MELSLTFDTQSHLYPIGGLGYDAFLWIETLLLFRYQVSILIWKSIFPWSHGNRWVSRRRRGARVDTAPRPTRAPPPHFATCYPRPFTHAHMHTTRPLLTKQHYYNTCTLTHCFRKNAEPLPPPPQHTETDSSLSLLN